MSAEPAEQRELILQLANALQIWQHMQDGAGLAVLEQLAPVDEALQPRTWLGERSLLERLAFERHYMQSPGRRTVVSHSTTVVNKPGQP